MVDNRQQADKKVAVAHMHMETESCWRLHSQTNKQTVGTPIRKEPLSKIDRATAFQGNWPRRLLDRLSFTNQGMRYKIYDVKIYIRWGLKRWRHVVKIHVEFYVVTV